MAEDQQQELDAVLAALAHEARRHILLVVWFAGGSMSAGEIAARFAHSWPTTSRHLRVLEQAGLLRFEKQGRSRVYQVNDGKLHLVRDWLRWFQDSAAEGPRPAPSAAASPEILLRNIALAYPRTREDVEGPERAIKVGRKTFAVLRTESSGFTLSVKLPQSWELAVQYAFVQPIRYRLGRSAWIMARLERDHDVPVELLWEWLDESYRAMAARRDLDQLAPPPTIQHKDR